MKVFITFLPLYLTNTGLNVKCSVKPDVFVKHVYPRLPLHAAATYSNKGKNLEFLHFDLAPFQGELMMSLRCEQPLDELSVQVSLPYIYANSKYCTLYVSRMELWTNGQTDWQSEY